VLFAFDFVPAGGDQQASLTSGWQPHPPATFFCAQIEAPMEEIILFLGEFLIEPLIELVGSLVLRFLFGK